MELTKEQELKLVQAYKELQGAKAKLEQAQMNLSEKIKNLKNYTQSSGNAVDEILEDAEKALGQVYIAKNMHEHE